MKCGTNVELALINFGHLRESWASLVAQMVKNPPVVRETWVWSLGQEDTLEKGMATHSSVLGWRIPWTGKPGGLQSQGHKELDMTERLSFSTFYRKDGLPRFH